MNKLFFDIETTGVNPYVSEIITGSFLLLDNHYNYLSRYEFRSQVDSWNHDAEKIHKISHSETMTYPAKHTALDGLTRWLSSAGLFECYLYANPNTELGYLFFDVATLQMQLMNYLDVNLVEKQPFKPQKINSVYLQAKEMVDYYQPITYSEAFKVGITNDEKHYVSNRLCYKQAAVYYALFNDLYDMHDANADVDAMLRIHVEFNRLKDNNLKSQLELI